MLYLKNPAAYKSASAFAPAWCATTSLPSIQLPQLTLHSNPSLTPWGKNAFSNYLSPTTKSYPPREWLTYDSSYLLLQSSAPKGSLRILVDVGTEDGFLKDGQLEPQALEKAAEKREKGEVKIRMQEGFDHSYYFVSGLHE
jgi:S-formylglutathione hydrolase